MPMMRQNRQRDAKMAAMKKKHDAEMAKLKSYAGKSALEIIQSTE